MLCPKCGSPMPDDGWFCGSCGYNIRENAEEEKVPSISSPVSSNSAFGRAMDLVDEAEMSEPAPAESDFAAAADLANRAESGTEDALPVFSGRKRGVSKPYERHGAAPEMPKEPEVAPPPAAVPVKPAAAMPVYKPVMPGKPAFNWKKLLAALLVLAIIIGGITWIVEANLFDGSSGSRKDRDDDDDKRDKDDDDDDDGGSHGQSSAPSGWQGYECSGLMIYLPKDFEVGYSYADALYCYTDTYNVEVVCGPISDIDSSIRNASDFADYYEYQISGYYDYERGSKNGVPYIMIYDDYYDQTLVYGFYVSGGYGWLTAAYYYGEGDVNTLITYATNAEIDSSNVPEPTYSYDDYEDYEDYYDDSGYGGGVQADSYDCPGCDVGWCVVCGGDGIYSNYGFDSECTACDDGRCIKCDGSGIITYYY